MQFWKLVKCEIVVDTSMQFKFAEVIFFKFDKVIVQRYQKE